MIVCGEWSVFWITYCICLVRLCILYLLLIKVHWALEKCYTFKHIIDSSCSISSIISQIFDWSYSYLTSVNCPHKHSQTWHFWHCGDRPALYKNGKCCLPESVNMQTDTLETYQKLRKRTSLRQPASADFLFSLSTETLKKKILNFRFFTV